MSSQIKNAKSVSKSDELETEERLSIIEDRKMMGEERKQSIENAKFNRLQNKIEQARRNVEVISKTFFAFAGEGGKDIQKSMMEVLALSLKIMKEVENINK